MKFIITLLSIFSLSSIAPAQAAVRYIDDNLFIYIHSGPSTQFRIMGSVNAGTPVDVKQWDKEAGFAQIEDDRGRIGWVDTNYISETPPALTQLPLIQQELEETKQVLAEIEQSNNQVLLDKAHTIEEQGVQITNLIAEKDLLTQEIDSLKLSNETLQTRLNNQSEDVQMQWLIRGGAVLGAGIFLGLIIPFLPRRRKKDPHWT
ncbi:TIGR04211 family SH3 domain-containing protein [Motilimonas sp. 1_MG-2023]|uniref:TIGR04211 family SH3 domain-containing protein n=1 Tax=Motilimonas TaxID=1914248 RepID=UPI001E47CD59|nr:TIGR04211 family SH3 domain-containing protein [Motilimonas sp. 1_MG-2023]MCE0557422.1 TIGR04211 family SH3 domain-containing protein [Motilimonas sp. E26]MDO6526876.1 TIGR04211 family SH3 domain-containing protein [Motilimonas sp. 1_MG-2023]